MPPSISRLASGLALLNFQGITADGENLLVTPIDGDILEIGISDGSMVLENGIPDSKRGRWS
jgi:hypothetical protein